jgi:3-hydroxyisobutyrate dehydrogenase
VTAISVLGLGAMGSRIATRLLARGHAVSVWSRDRAKTTEPVSRGAVELATPADAVGRSELAIVMVTDGAALHAVTEEPGGLLTGTGTVVVGQMSTVAPDDVRRLAAALPLGWDLLDAPVLGSRAEAASGTLKILVGASEELFGQYHPALAELGAPVRFGPVGAGTAAKLVANATLFGVLGVLGEALSLASALGLPTDAAAQVLAVTPLAGEVDRRLAAIADGGYPPRFALTLASKDADLIMAAAAEGGADLRLAEAMRGWLTDARSAGWGGHDYTAVLSHILASAPKPR